MTTPVIERSAASRIDISGKVTYQIGDSDELRSGEIENLDVGGTLIWIAHELPVDSRLLLRLEPECEDETVFAFEAVLLARLRKQKESLYGYACRIELY